MKIKLDKERNIEFKMSSAYELEKAIDEPFIKTMSGFVNSPNDVSVKKVMAILWAGLIHEDKELTLDGLYEIFDKIYFPFNDLLGLLSDPIAKFFQGGKEKNVKSPAKKIPTKKK